MGGRAPDADRERTKRELDLESIPHDIGRLRASIARMRANLEIFDKAKADEEARIEHLENIIEELEAKEVRETRALELQKRLQTQVDRGISE